MVLFEILKRLISQLTTLTDAEALRTKIDVLYAGGRLTESQYLDLIALLEAKIQELS